MTTIILIVLFVVAVFIATNYLYVLYKYARFKISGVENFGVEVDKYFGIQTVGPYMFKINGLEIGTCFYSELDGSYFVKLRMDLFFIRKFYILPKQKLQLGVNKNKKYLRQYIRFL